MSATISAFSAPRRRAYRMLVLNELRLAWRTPTYLVVGIGIPVLVLIILGSIPSLVRPSQVYGGASFFTLYTPTLTVLVAFILGLMSLPSRMALYREQGVLHRMSTTPVPASALLGAQVVVNVLFAVFSFALLLGVGAGAFHLDLPVQFGWLILSLTLAVAAMFGIGLCIAAVASTSRVALVIGGLLFYPSAFSAGMYGPLSVYPRIVGQIAKWTPTGAAFNAIHTSLGGRFPGWTSVGVLVACAAVFSALATRWFRWDVERAHARRGRIPALLTFTRSVTLPANVTGERVARALRDGLPSRFEVEPATKFKGRLFGLRTEPAEPDVMVVTSGATSIGRAEVTIERGSLDTSVHIRSGGQVLYSALSVTSKIRRVLIDLADESPPSAAGSTVTTL
ncbi:MAG: ABC transporter permease [Acidimicrobiales bacterium]